MWPLAVGVALCRIVGLIKLVLANRLRLNPTTLLLGSPSPAFISVMPIFEIGGVIWAEGVRSRPDGALAATSITGVTDDNHPSKLPQL